MSPDLSALSPSQFESLSADLIGRDLGLRFEQFAEGPDGGMDGRHVTETEGVTILQAKRYAKSAMPALKRTLKEEREKIDRLAPARYVLATSVSMTPARKQELMEICGSSLRTPGDVYGREDLEGLLRAHPDIEEAHPSLWTAPSGGALERVMVKALERHERGRRPPEVLSNLLPRRKGNAEETTEAPRDVLFLLGVRPLHDQFILWLGPKLEAHGYCVFSEIQTLEPGDRWRKETRLALEHRAAKVLVAVSSELQADDDAMDMLDRAKSLGDEIGDQRFLVPLKLEDGAKIDGLRDAVPADFSKGWAEGLAKLLEALERQRVPRQPAPTAVAPQWDAFRKRGAVLLVPEPEPLASNWIQIVELPDHVHFYEAVGSVRNDVLQRKARTLSFPAVPHDRGLITFADPSDIEEQLKGIAKLSHRASVSIADAATDGMPEIKLKGRDLSNIIIGLLRDAWERHCRRLGMVGYGYSNGEGFHVSPAQAAIGDRIPWGRQGERRSSMLRNIANKHVWSYGVTAVPRNWPFWHFRLKARVLFAKDNETEEGERIDDSKKMHRLRRSGCKGWRNKQWHGRLLAFLQVMSGDSAFIRVALAPGNDMLLSSEPFVFTSPVSTSLPDAGDPDAEEDDPSTLGRPEAEDDVEVGPIAEGSET